MTLLYAGGGTAPRGGAGSDPGEKGSAALLCRDPKRLAGAMPMGQESAELLWALLWVPGEPSAVHPAHKTCKQKGYQETRPIHYDREFNPILVFCF